MNKNKQDLQEIKKGGTGYGLLIENDGYISADLTQHNKQLKESFDESDEWFVPKPFIVDAVFQKYDVKNANGRIYPEAILKREVEKYQERIKNRNAYGECYKPDVLVLTEDGWKKLSDVKEGDMVLTLNTSTNIIEKQPVVKKIEYDYNGDMIHIKGRNIDDVVTPNHGFPIYNRNGKFKCFLTATQIMEKDDLEDFYIPNSKENINDGISLDKKEISLIKEAYEGKVMCIEVENHTWYVMSNGKCHWTKNCNHPSDSTIDLGRISHNIIELHWVGKTLVGKMELNISEGFRRNGICSSLGDTVALLLLNGYLIGVSSRAVGSVEQRLGQTIVGDDLEIICWDIVSDNSTPGAKISMNGPEELQQYIESDNTKKNKSKLDEKLSKVEQILKD